MSRGDCATLVGICALSSALVIAGVYLIARALL